MVSLYVVLTRFDAETVEGIKTVHHMDAHVQVQCMFTELQRYGRITVECMLHSCGNTWKKLGLLQNGQKGMTRTLEINDIWW